MKYTCLALLAYILLTSSCKVKKDNPPILPNAYSIMCAPITSDKEWYNSDQVAPLFEGMDAINFPISTDNSLAQKYFNQGMIMAYGFNHAEAARSFYYATRLDSTCAMAHWGYAFVLGPNYNAGMESDNYERAYQAIQKAKTLSQASASPKEKALIDALSLRYIQKATDDRSHLDIAYADAFSLIYKKYPSDPDIGALYAEALMNLHPWDLWDSDGNEKEWTPQIMNVLQQVIAIRSDHPGAHHYYIHVVEASNKPERGLESAQILDDGIVPSAGHLLHMPSHIYIRTGDYHKGSLSNIKAIAADSNYLSTCHAQGSYPLTLYPHNYHFLAATATLEGNSTLAIKAADKVSQHANRKLMAEPGWGTIQHYYTIPYYIKVKFGKWNDILKMGNDVPTLKYPTGVRHYARGLAFLGLNKIEKATEEFRLLKEIAADQSLKEVTIWDFNNTHQLLQIASKVLEAEILAKNKDFNKSILLLKEAVNLEDKLVYQEPPDWFFSVRHHLGVVQINAKEYSSAIYTYMKDLENYPRNGWALHGLQSVYSKLEDDQKLSDIKKQIEEIWLTSDIELQGSQIASIADR